MVSSKWHELLRRIRRVLKSFETERTDDTSSWSVTISLEPDPLDGGWVAEVLELPGVMSQGETKDEAMANAMSAFVEALAVRVEQQKPDSHPLPDTDSAELRRVALPV